MTAPETIRRNFVEHISILANADAQLRYERDVPHVPAHVELIESFFDSYHPGDSAFEAAFVSEEKKCLADLERMLDSTSLEAVHSVSDLLASASWQSLIRKAQEAAELFAKAPNQPPEPTR